MAQCEKCGKSDRVVSKERGYWGRALSWTFASILLAGVHWMNLDGTEGEVYIWVICGLFALIAINLWIKTFSGKTYIQHECKYCGNKWRDGYKRF